MERHFSCQTPQVNIPTACLHLQKILVDGRNVVPDVWDVLDKIKNFSEKVGARTGRVG
jgi:hypothetical protein